MVERILHRIRKNEGANHIKQNPKSKFNFVKGLVIQQVEDIRKPYNNYEVNRCLRGPVQKWKMICEGHK